MLVSMFQLHPKTNIYLWIILMKLKKNILKNLKLENQDREILFIRKGLPKLNLIPKLVHHIIDHRKKTLK